MKSFHKIEEYFLSISELFCKNFGTSNKKQLPWKTENQNWLNYFYHSPLFRHIHLELYKTKKMCVMHINAFPDPRVDIPILGFDVIAIGEKITGIFFDFTPILTKYKILQDDLILLNTLSKSPKRILPEWANFFSENFYCVTPEEEELNLIFSSIKSFIIDYLQTIILIKTKYDQNVNIQNNYCQQQKKNDKTSKALIAEIGKENTSIFLHEYLFPELN